MGTIVRHDRPEFTIGSTRFSDGEVWDCLGAVNTYTTTDPNVSPRYFPKAAPSRENGYNPPNVIDTSAAAPTSGFSLPFSGPRTVWAFHAFREPYYGYGQREDYWGPLFLRGGKFLVLKIDTETGSIEPQVRISSGFSIGKDFLPGAVATVAIAVVAPYIVEGVLGYGAETAVTTAGVETAGSGVAVSAVGGSGVGIVTTTLAPLAATETAAVAVGGGVTFAEVMAGAKAGVGVVQTVAGAAAVISKAVAGAGSGGSVQPAPQQSPVQTSDNTMLYIGAAILAVLVLQ